MKAINFKDSDYRIPGYEFEDLKIDTKNKVITDHIKFILETFKYEDLPPNVKKGVDKSNSLLTPWFTIGYVWDYAEDEIMEDLKNSDYLYDVEGNILPIRYHTKNGEVKYITYKDKPVELEPTTESP